MKESFISRMCGSWLDMRNLSLSVCVSLPLPGPWLGCAGNNRATGPIGAVRLWYACISLKDVPPSLKYTQLEVWEQRDLFPLLICPTCDDVCGSQGSSYLYANSFDWQLWKIVGELRRCETPTEKCEGDTMQEKAVWRWIMWRLIGTTLLFLSSQRVWLRFEREVYVCVCACISVYTNVCER